MRKHAGTVVVFVVLTVVAGAVAWQALGAGESADAGGPGDDVRPIAVELARVERDLIRDVRVLSGTLEASTRFTVAAEVAGVLRQLSVDLGSEVEPDTVIGKIDDAPLLQAVAESEAELEVRRAELGRAGTNLDLRQREFERETSLLEDGVTAEAAYDVALADLRAAESTYKLAEARLSQAEASLRLARLGLEDTLLRAEWTGEVERVVVGQRYVDPGSTLRPGDPVVTLVSLERLRAVVSVTERDYTKLRIGQVATLSADAIEGRTFEATITRIAPVFDEASRQARIEIEVDNRAALLKPGMFVRARLILEERPAAVVAPLDAITRRDGEDVVFVYDEQETVSMIPVRMGIEEDGRVELIADRPIDGARVVTLGHQLLSDGSLVNVPGDAVAEFEPAGALPPVEKAERAAE